MQSRFCHSPCQRCMASQRHANEAPGEFMRTRRDEGERRSFVFFFVLFFSIILKMKKPRRRASCPGTAGTPHRNTLINTGSLEELKPPATSCSQTGESAEHLLHILLSVMRNRHTHTHTHTHTHKLTQL